MLNARSVKPMLVLRGSLSRLHVAFPDPQPTLTLGRRPTVAGAARGLELLAGLENLKTKHEAIGDVRGLGLMCALELVSDRQKKSAPSKESVQKVQDVAYKAGVMVRTSGPNIILSPPLIITSKDVTRILSALDEGLSA